LTDYVANATRVDWRQQIVTATARDLWSIYSRYRRNAHTVSV